MVFSSTVFLYGFLPLFLLVYCLLPARLRNGWLLLSSLFFYAWGEVWFVLVMMASILIDFSAGLFIAGARLRGPEDDVPLLEVGGERTRRQRFGLLFSIVTNLGILVSFKYFNFLVDSYNGLLDMVGLPTLHWEPSFSAFLPLGISFFTFQSMSYTFDVYLGHVKATRNLRNFATYVSMFPQLVAGPIVRYQEIAASLIQRTVRLSDFSYGVQRFVMGLGKKVILANAFSVPADQIFSIPNAELTPALAWLGVAAYTLQIYFDFSGYSDMAIGLGRMLGFRFLENFDYPYISRSITEFWRRWHISLSSWFKSYVYIPAGGSREGPLKTYRNLWLVFFLCGLWHGASWNFAFWGLYHGVLLIVERMLRTPAEPATPNLFRLPRAAAWLGHLYVLLAVMIGWVFFRAESFGQSWAFLKAMAGSAEGSGLAYYPALYFDRQLLLVTLVAIVGSCPVVPFLASKLSKEQPSESRSSRRWVQEVADFSAAVFVLAVFLLSAVKLASTTHNPFIYFRF
ncbi:MAG: MBOAT family protein [Thermoanaerobaculia bacterium]|nr:MBOAT family protein [Thermoanaerobaculia bacterium]